MRPRFIPHSLFGALALCGPVCGAAADVVTAPFLFLGAGARAAALGQAYTAVANDATAVYWNPAGTPFLPRQTASLTHVGLQGDAFVYDQAAWARSWGKGGVGIGVQHFSAGALDRADGTGVSQGTFAPRDVAVLLSLARAGRAGSVGVNAKWIQRRVDGTARAVVADIGVLTPFFAGGRLRLAAVAANLGGRLRFEDIEEKIPVSTRAGGVARLGPSVFITAEAEKIAGADPSPRVGIEHALEGPRGALALRAGYDGAAAKDDGPGGFAGGVGIGFPNIKIDYALVPARGGQVAHWVTVSTWF